MTTTNTAAITAFIDKMIERGATHFDYYANGYGGDTSPFLDAWLTSHHWIGTHDVGEDTSWADRNDLELAERGNPDATWTLIVRK